MERSGIDQSIRPFVSRMGKGISAVAMVVSVLAVPAIAADAPSAPTPKVITPDKARQHIGMRVTVTLRVLHAKAATSPDRVYLDSEKDYRDPRNLGVLIEADALPVFEKGGITKPAEHYDGKTIRITGTVFLRDDNVFIKAASPRDIEIIPTKNGS